MKERFENLYKLPNNLYVENSPVIIVAGSLLKDTESSNLIIQLKYHSLSDKKIKALKIKLNVYDVTKQLLGDDIEYQYLDLNILQGQEFGANKAIIVSDLVARSFSIKEFTVIYENNEQWVSTIPLVQLINSQSLSIELKDPEVVKQYRLATNDSANYVPKEMFGLWQCTCGEWNNLNNCSKCHINKVKVFDSYNEEELKELAKIRVIDEKEKAERIAKQKAEEESVRKKNRKKILMITFPILIVIGIILALIPGVIRPAIENMYAYNTAKEMLDKGAYDDAKNAFDELGEYRDSYILSKEAIYRKAKEYLETQQYNAATYTFESIIGYLDAEVLAKEAQYQKANDFYNRGKYEMAIEIWEDLDTYSDSKDRITMTEYEWKENDYQKAIQFIKEKKYEDAIEYLLELPDDYKDKIDLLNQSIENLALQYYESSKYEESKKILEEWNKTEIELYLKSCYMLAVEKMNIQEYDSAIRLFSSLENYEDSADLLMSCKNEKTYLLVLGYLEDGELTKAKEALSQLPSDYKKTSEFLTLINQYSKYDREWTCLTYRIHHDDGKISNLDYDADRRDMISSVSIDENANVIVKFDGCTAKINGNIATWYPFGSYSDTTSTFDMSTGYKEMQFYTSKGLKSDTYIFTYKVN